MNNMADYGMISSLDIDELIMLKQNQKYLEMHPYAVWQSKDCKYWYTTLPDSTKERGVRQVKRKTKNELESVIIEYWKSTANHKTVADVFNEWNDNRLELRKIIQATYIGANCIFKRHFDDIADKLIEDMRPIDWSDFLEHEIVKHNLTRDMFINLKGVVSGMLKWSFKRGYVKYSMSAVNDLIDISPKVYRDNHKDDSAEVFNEDETNKVMDYLMANQDLLNLGLLLMFVTGIRVGELVSLKPSDFCNNILKIRRTRTTILNKEGKITRGVKDTPKSTSGIRDIIVPTSFKWLMDHFACGNLDEYIFVTEFGNLYRNDSFCRRLRNICNELEIPYRSPHKIRKTYTSILLDNNVDSRFVIEQSGHSDISCTENYYHKNRKSLDKKTEIIDSIKEFQ